MQLLLNLTIKGTSIVCIIKEDTAWTRFFLVLTLGKLSPEDIKVAGPRPQSGSGSGGRVMWD